MDWALEPEDRELLVTACEAAERAGEVHRRRAADAAPIRWEEKGESDFVTEADREAERAIVTVLRDRFPEHIIMAEEEATDRVPPSVSRSSLTAAEPQDGRMSWIVDPLDGTTNWLHGYPEYAVSIAAADADGLRLGVVLNSTNGELFTSVRGCGSRLNGQPVHVSPVSETRLALVGTGFPFKKLEMLPGYLEMFDRVLRGTAGVRRAGAAALDLCNLACGRLDAFWELWLMPWDFAAGILIIREAGGVVERLPPRIEPAGPDMSADTAQLEAGGGELLWPGGLLAANPALFQDFRALVLSKR
jgi:myo-inositol-1(or 4)-monophosphatase